MTRQLIVFGTAIMTTLLALVVFWQFRIVVLYVLVSLAVAATVRPFVKYWSRHGLVMRLVLILVCLVSLGGFGFLFFHVGRFVISDFQQLAQTLLVQTTWKLPPWLEDNSFQQMLGAWLPTPAKLLEEIASEQSQFVLPAVLSFTQGIGGIVSGIIVVLLLSLYWSINQINFERLWLSLLPSEIRKHARDIWRTIESELGAYIRSEIIQSFLAALLLGFGYWLIGFPYPILLALIGALAWLIPVVGAALAVILLLLFGLLTGSLQLSLFAAFYTLIVLVALQIWVEPRLFKRKWDNPILTLIILLAMADAFGLPGIIAAPPLSAVCQILWSVLVSNRLASGEAAEISDLKLRQIHLRAVVEEMGENPPPLVISSMERLTNLLEKAELLLPAALPAETSEPFHPSQPVTAEDGSPITTKP